MSDSFNEFLKLMKLAQDQKYLGPVNRRRFKKLARKHLVDILSLERKANMTGKEIVEMSHNVYLNLIK